HKEPIPLGRRDTARGCIRLNDKPFFFELRHFIADRRRRDLQLIFANNRPRTDRDSGPDKIINDGEQKLVLSLFHKFIQMGSWRKGPEILRKTTGVFQSFVSIRRRKGMLQGMALPLLLVQKSWQEIRSEERRVGKECRSGWATG